jgi:hypothetical protein
MLLNYMPFLIPAGLALFILRAQLLRVSIRELGMENIHASKGLGAASGWASLFGAVTLALLAFLFMGVLWGAALVVIGLVLGVVSSALFLPMLGRTLAMGMHGGEGDKSVAAFNRRYGHWIAFAVAGMALVGLYGLFSFRF